jgi:hypothetical protein
MDSNGPITKQDCPPSPSCGLLLYGSELSLEQVSEVLGLAPDQSVRCGDVRQSGRHSLVYPHAFWGLDSQDHINSSALEDHVAWILDAVTPERLERVENITDAVLAVYHIQTVEMGGFDFSVQQISRIAALGVRVDVHCDYWPSDESSHQDR